MEVALPALDVVALTLRLSISSPHFARTLKDVR